MPIRLRLLVWSGQEYHCAIRAAAHDGIVMSAAQDKPGVATPATPATFELQLDDPETLSNLRRQYHSGLVNALVGRGASPVEAEDLLADLWGECVGRADGESSLLEKYSGKCPVQSWLLTVATHRLLDLKRRLRHRGELAKDEGGSGNNPFDQLPASGPGPAELEGGLVELLKESLRAAFAQCPGEAMLMLRLVYLNGLSQRELALMWGWHESKVSRCMSEAMSRIEQITLNQVRRRDAWLQLGWQDFLELCESHQLGFL